VPVWDEVVLSTSRMDRVLALDQERFRPEPQGTRSPCGKMPVPSRWRGVLLRDTASTPAAESWSAKRGSFSTSWRPRRTLKASQCRSTSEPRGRARSAVTSPQMPEAYALSAGARCMDPCSASRSPTPHSDPVRSPADSCSGRDTRMGAPAGRPCYRTDASSTSSGLEPPSPAFLPP
jgi:hypothetical protein